MKKLSKISARFEHTQIIAGYCQICGEFKKLSADHVPPKGSIPLSAVEQKTIMEYANKTPLKGVKGKRGSVFKTICQKCNSDLGLFDSEIKRVSERIGDKVKRHFSYANSPYNLVIETINVQHYLRGVIGHMLASTSVKRCLEPIVYTDFYQPLRDFVLGRIDSIDATHDVFYWFYPNRFNVSGSGFGIGSLGDNEPIIGAALYFFPIAIFVGSKGHNNPQLLYRQRLTIDKPKLFIDLSSNLFEQSVFPFMGLRGTTILAFSDAYVTVSYPVKY